MEKEYDFSSMTSQKNPYAAKLKKQVTIAVSNDILTYFQDMAKETGISYQNLIHLYLSDCVAKKRKPDLLRQCQS